MSGPDEPSEVDRRAWRTDESWMGLRARMAAADRARAARSRLIRAGVVSVAGVLAAGAAFLIARNRPTESVVPPISHVVATAAGEHKTVTLRDGTVIQLAPASTIRWTELRDRREVRLEGLADFRVVHDATRPFTVRARDAQATDIGTEFVVRAYAGDSAARVSVLSGVVALARRQQAPTDSKLDASATVTLHAGEVGIVAPSKVARLAQTTTLGSDSAWVHGALRFDDAPLGDVAIELGRWFGATIRVDDPALARKRVTAIYAQPELGPVVDALAATVDGIVVHDGPSYHLRIRER